MRSQSSSKPKFPFIEGPRDYQQSAYVNWCNSNKKGIFAMATGTGKTITSLNCLFEEYQLTKVYQAVIIVPTLNLVNQWEEECVNFNFNRIIKVSSLNNRQSELSDIISTQNYLNTSFVIIVTYASFKTNKFFNLFLELPDQTILIADEAHNIGSKSVLKINQIHLESRIGLSATPDRQFDEEGNNSINAFFQDKYLLL